MTEIGKTINQAKRELTEKTLEQFGGNRTHSARSLGISIRTLRNWIKAWSIQNAGRELSVTAGSEIICPECWAPIAQARQALYHGQELTMSCFQFRREPTFDDQMRGCCWFSGCQGKWFVDGKIFTKQGWKS